ncbi:MAG: hypothetical protein RLZZ199_77 [Actinomycetota bacterium]
MVHANRCTQSKSTPRRCRSCRRCRVRLPGMLRPLMWCRGCSARDSTETRPTSGLPFGARWASTRPPRRNSLRCHDRTGQRTPTPPRLAAASRSSRNTQLRPRVQYEQPDDPACRQLMMSGQVAHASRHRTRTATTHPHLRHLRGSVARIRRCLVRAVLRVNHGQRNRTGDVPQSSGTPCPRRSGRIGDS